MIQLEAMMNNSTSSSTPRVMMFAMSSFDHPAGSALLFPVPPR